ncbi:MAG: hotdog fold thioesterase [Parachlamydiaceae bacterium]
MIWFKNYTLEEISSLRLNTMVEFLGIEFVNVTPETLSARMPVDHRTKQPYGILHGGASCALAESVGSIAGNLVVDPEKKVCVGLDIFTSHLKMAKDGFVTAIAKPIRLGSSIQVWEIPAFNDDRAIISQTRLTLAVLDRRK